MGPSDAGIRGSMDPSALDERKTPVRGAQARRVPVSDEQPAGGAGAGAVAGETRLEVPTGGYAWGGRRPDGTVYIRFDEDDEWLFPKDESPSPEAGARDDSVQSDGEDDVTLDPDSKVGRLVSALRAVADDQDQARERAIADWYASFKRSMSERAETMQARARLKTSTESSKYVSGALHRSHAAARLSWVLLELDRARFQVFVHNSRDLSSFEENPEGSMRDLVDEWVDIWGLDTAAAVGAIVADEIDILVDSAGITFNHRLDVFACSAAPIQVTWIGYPNTTGVETIHYRVTDAVTDPMATTQQFSEKLIRLPDCFLCYAPKGFVDQMPPVSAPPSEENGYITFGSFNQIAKVQHECLELWCRVLRAVPNSRINLKYITFKAEAFREEWFAKFHARGIARERVTFMSFFPATSGHLAAYDLHDNSLDTFPYNAPAQTHLPLGEVWPCGVKGMGCNCIFSSDVCLSVSLKGTGSCRMKGNMSGQAIHGKPTALSVQANVEGR